MRDYDGQRHHMAPAELMDKNQDFLRKIGFSRLFNQGRISAAQARAKMNSFLQGLQRQLTSGQYTTLGDPRLINAIRTLSF